MNLMGLMTERTASVDMVGIEKSHGSGEENTSCCCWDTGEFVRLKYGIHPRAPMHKLPMSPVISRIIVARQ